MNPSKFAELARKLLIGIIVIAFLIGPITVKADSGSDPQIRSASGIQIEYYVFLPQIVNGINTGETPQLISPLDGAVLNTRIPIFNWDIKTQPANTSGCFALSTTPHPTGCQMSFYIFSSTLWSEVSWNNLEPSTVYYWRVGAIYNNDYSNPKWSDEWSFTTGPTGGQILAAPSLESPADNANLPTTQLLKFTWKPVVGAVEYAVTVHGIDTNRWMGSSGISTTELNLNFNQIVQMYGTHLEWFVQARNDYAWGSESERWKVNLPPATASLNWMSFGKTPIIHQDERVIDVIR